MYTLTNIIQAIIIFQGGLLTLFILISNKSKSRNDFFLALLIGTLTLQLLGMFLMNSNIQPDFLESVNGIYLFLYGPLLYFYSKHITFLDFKFKPNYLVHFIPFIAVLAIAILTEEQVSQTILYIAYAIHILCYIFACFWELKKYKKVLMDNYSQLEWLNLRWLRWTLILFSLIVLVDGIQMVSILIIQKVLRLEVILFLLVLAATNLLYFNVYIRPIESRTGFNFEDLKLSTSMTHRKRLNTSLLENKVLIDRLNNHLNSGASYKNPQLTIGLLAEEIDIPKRTLSELINDHYDQNFVDFINTQRINCAKQRLLNPTDPNETILEVMYEVGFNSKSSFHKAFKKKTGSTPAEYKTH